MFLISQNKQELRNIWGQKVRGCKALFSSVLHLDILIVFLLLFHARFNEIQKKQCKSPLGTPIAMKIIKKSKQ
jgi:hypothetical protein